MRSYLLASFAAMTILTTGCSAIEDAIEGPETEMPGETGPDPAGDMAQEKRAQRHVSQVRQNIPGAQAYDDDDLLTMAETVCLNGTPENAMQVVDNYSAIEAADREEYVLLTFHNYCD